MTQNEMILADLEKGVKITPLTALSRYGCLRLAARIQDLRDRGYNIKTEMVWVKKVGLLTVILAGPQPVHMNYAGMSVMLTMKPVR